MKRVVYFLLTAAIVFSALLTSPVDIQASGVSDAELNVELGTVKLMYKGSYLGMQTILYNDRVYAPLRELCRLGKLGVNVDSKSGIVDLVTGNAADSNSTGTSLKADVRGMQSINVMTDPYNITVDGINTYIHSFLYQDTTFVPVRLISDYLGKRLAWNDNEKTVIMEDTSGETVGMVNGEDLLKDEFDFFFNTNVVKSTGNLPGKGNATDPATLSALKKQAYDIIVNRKILRQKVSLNSIHLEKTDIDRLNAYLDQLVANYRGIENVKKALEESGVSLYEFILVSKDDYLFGKLQQKLTTSIFASEDQLKQYYVDNKESFVIPESVTAKHILFLTTDQLTGQAFDQEKKAAAKKKAGEVLASIEAGEDFDKLMVQYSEDPGLNGSLNGYTFGRGEMVREFEQAAFSLKEGEVSGIVETVYGYHIIKTINKQPERLLSYEEVREIIKEDLDGILKQEYFNGLITKYRAESTIGKMTVN